MSDVDEALAATAVGLNEDSKAARKAKPKTSALKAAQEHLSGEALPAEDLPGDGGAREAQQKLAIDNIEQMGAQTDIATKTAIFDFRDLVLRMWKERPKNWKEMGETEQRETAAAVENSVTDIVRKFVEAVAADGKEPIRVLLTKVTLGDDIQLTGKVKPMGTEEEDRAVVLLHAARGKHVLLTVASADDYRQGSRAPGTDPDQPDLGFEAGDDDAPTAEDAAALADELENDEDRATGVEV